MHNLLQKIVENKRREIATSQKFCPIESLREIVEPSERDFRAALADGRAENYPKLVAEFKRKSPSKKAFPANPELEKVVEIYDRHAAAVSILTDREFFGGCLEDLENARATTDLPILRKDFIFDEYQILEARQFGADAILLIARILEIDELEKLILSAKKLGMSALVEIHDTSDLSKVAATSAEIVGVNSRNLDTLAINFNGIFELAAQIAPEKIVVAESGISSRDDFAKLVGKFDAALVGSALLEAENLETKLLEFDFSK
jgi:indole-3-glycerol phosphate synthase